MAPQGRTQVRRSQRRKHRRGPTARPRRPAAATNRVEVRSLLQWLLPDAHIFRELKPHGNTTWQAGSLVCLALCWAWAEQKLVTAAFAYGSDWCRSLAAGTVLSTYQGMMGALERWTGPLMTILWRVLQQRMEQLGSENWKIEGWVPIAFDGSRQAVPRTVANETAFSAPHYGHGMTARYRKKQTMGMRRKRILENPPAAPYPMLWTTLMWHVGLRLPWMWRLGPSNTSERDDVLAMLREGKFPENTLFCGDAGFVGYDLWSAMLAKGCHFLVRVGGNVNLLTELADCRLDRRTMRVWSWPGKARASGKAPLELRLVHVRVGKTGMWLLTSVLDRQQLRVKQMREIYKQRWGIEVEFRGLKQTLDKGALRCRTAARVKVEQHWSLMAMSLAELFAVKEQLAAQPRPAVPERLLPAASAAWDPQKRSLAETISALRWSLTHLHETPRPGETLTDKLRQAQTDAYIRNSSKAARYRPPNKDKKKLGHPRIRPFTPRETLQRKALQRRILQL